MTFTYKQCRVLVRLPNWIGDAVMALPAVNAVKLSHPDWEVTCLGKASVIALFIYDQQVDRSIEFKLPEGRSKLSALRAFARDLRQLRFDIGISLPDSFSSALVLRLADIPRRVGYRSELRTFLLTDPIKPFDGIIHRSERYAKLVARALAITEIPDRIDISVSSREIERANDLLRGIHQLAVVCPTSRAPSRRWGTPKYVELIRRLHQELGYVVALAGARDETDAIAEIGRSTGVPFLNLAEQGDVLLSVEIMRRAEVFVGNDSGAAHLAAAAGTRVVSISGADDPRETRPLARISAIVNKHVECSPCAKNVCTRKDHVNLCMDAITVDDVFQAVVDILKVARHDDNSSGGVH
jgi:heptosyltransferase-2